MGKRNQTIDLDFRSMNDPQSREKFAEAKRKARYGHYDVVLWVDRHGIIQFARRSQETLKRALLDTGTGFYFQMYGANDAIPFIISWPLGTLMWRNAKYY